MATPIRTTPIEDALIARASGQLGTGQGKDWFGPGQPLAPQAPPEVKGRQFDYPFAVNLSTRPRDEQANVSIPFEVLQQVADPGQGGLDLLRLAIQTVKYQMGAQKWTVKSTDRDKARNRKRDPKAEEIKRWLRKPDGITPWITWMWQVVEDHLVIDAPTIYHRKAPGNPYQLLEVVDGSTIKRILDENGRTPLPPFPAFQQRLKGLPAVDYRLDELIYAPANLRPGRIYGMSQVEQVVGIVNLALRRQLSQTHYYTEGNVPEALVGVPETWNPDQIRDFQSYWDSLMEGNLAARRHMKFVPGGMQPTFTRDPKLKDELDEWLSRIICYCFNLSPQALVKEVNRATAETSKKSAQEEGTEVTKLWFKSAVMDEAFERAGITDYEFAYQEEEITDPEVKAKVYQMALGGKPWMTPDEVRETGYGLEPLTDEQKEELNPAPPPALVAPDDPAGKPGAKPGTTQGEAKGRSSASAPELPPAPGKKPAAKPEAAEKLAKAKPQKKKSAALPSIDRARPVLTRASKRIAALFKGYFRKQRKALLAAVQARAEKMAKMSLDDMEDLIGSLRDEKERAKLQRGLENLLGAVGEDGAEAALSQILEFTEPAEADLDAMLSQANEKAVEWAEARAAELVTEVDETTMDNIRSLVGQALEDGLSNDELADLIQQSEGFSDYRSEMIARTETAFADVQGNLAGWRETGVVESKKWIVAQDEVCDECHALDGVVVGLDEDFPDDGGDGPPLHPNCVLPGTLVSAAGVTKHFERWFEGEIVRVFIEGQDPLTVTPNHPILTGRGWIPACELSESDHVFSVSDPGAFVAACNPQDHHVQARIEEVADALLVAGGVAAESVPTAPEHFHGDGTPDQEVRIVRANRSLNIGAEPPGADHAAQLDLPITDADLMGFACRGDAAAVGVGLLPAPGGIVRSGNPGGAGLAGGPASLDPVGLAAIPDGQPSLAPGLAEGAAVASEGLGQINAALARFVSAVKIEKLVKGEKWAGHVYNLETEGGWFTASTIITHNCRCDIVPVLTNPNEEE